MTARGGRWLHGLPGSAVGAQSLAQPLVDGWGPRDPSGAKVYAAVARSRTVFYTPTVKGTFRKVVDDLNALMARVDVCIEQHLEQPTGLIAYSRRDYVQLLVVDEA